MPRPEPRELELVDPVAEHHQQRRVEGQRDRDGDRPHRKAAQDRVGHDQHAQHRQREGGAAEHDRTRCRARHGQDGGPQVRAPRALLAAVATGQISSRAAPD
jgi:hypothetical protein